MQKPINVTTPPQHLAKKPVLPSQGALPTEQPFTLGKMLGPERFQKLRETRGMEHDGLILPAEIADTYFHIAQQHRSAWTHEIDMRSFTDVPWWNH